MYLILKRIIRKTLDINFLKKTREDKVWISTKEIRILVLVILWLTRTEKPMGKYLHVLCSRMLKLWTTNGSNFTFLYFKSTVHILVRFLSGNPVDKTSSSGVLVRVDPKTKLPTIFPINLRAEIHNWTFSKDWLKMVALFSFLCLFRSFPTKVKVDTSSITDPSVGAADTLTRVQITEAVKSLNIKLSSRKGNRFVFSGKAGPNTRYACHGFGLDSLGLLQSKELYQSFIKLCMHNKSYLLLAAWFINVIFIFPYFFIFKKIKGVDEVINGKLGAVYNQAGKARVVAMVNVWIQSLFSGLHDSIFAYLKTNISDATFDQKGVLRSFISRNEGSTFYCYDLTAATDRLPLRLQEDILTSLGYKGDLWAEIIRSISWYHDGEFLKYAVGQPMGALSSWGMLALTHHIIVRVASSQAGKKDFTNYLVLGDDIVIADKDVAEKYLLLMTHLGVSINLSKSVISSRFAEFAKVWIGPGFEISPLGSGQLVQALRDRTSISLLFKECIDRGFFSLRELMNKRLLSCPRVLQRRLTSIVVHMEIIQFQLDVTQSLKAFAIKDLLHNSEIVNNFVSKFIEAYPTGYTWIRQTLNPLSIRSPVFTYINVLLSESYRSICSDWRSWKMIIKHIINRSWRSSTIRREFCPNLSLEMYLIPFSPNTYSVFFTAIEDLYKIVKRWFYLVILIHQLDRDSASLWNRCYNYFYPPHPDYGFASNFLCIALLFELSEITTHIPVYLEEKEKRKAHSLFLNRICQSEDTKMIYLSMLRLGEGLDPSVQLRSPDRERLRIGILPEQSKDW